MPRLLKQINAEIITEKIHELDGFNNVNAIISLGDYIDSYHYIGFIQYFNLNTKIEDFEDLKSYGLLGNNNRTFSEIEINY